MRGGFTFKGIDIADLFLEYAPELADTYIYRPTETTIHEETFEGHTGGYYYGLTKQPKEFTLRCFFEEHDINRGILEKIHWLFRKGNSGKLVFQRRPWCYYNATVTEVDDKELTNRYNGFIKITMKAYYPFARSDYMYYPENRLDYFKVMNTTAFLDKEEMMINTHNLELPITSSKSFLLYNPGTEYADVGIEIGGAAAQGVVIENKTTNQECKFIALSKTLPRAEGDGIPYYIYYDGINGKCVMKSTEEHFEPRLNFLYHDYGHINLAPGYPAIRNIHITGIRGKVVTTINFLYDVGVNETIEDAKAKYVGRYIYITDEDSETSKWYKISDVIGEHTLRLEENAPSIDRDEAIKTTAVIMNELVIRPVVEMEITHLDFIYKPTFA